MSDTLPSNPLLSLPFRVPFDQIRAEHVEPAMKELLRDARQRKKVMPEAPLRLT